MSSVQLLTGAPQRGFAFVAVDTSSAPAPVLLPASPRELDSVNVKDTVGNAVTFPFTVDGNGNTIDGALTVVVSVNFAAITVMFVGSEWLIV